MTAHSLAWSPLIPWSLIVAFAAVALLLLIPGLLRGAGGSLWRALAMALLLLTLAGPSLVSEDRQSVPDIALVVVDRSQSQQINDRAAETDRALAALLPQLEALADTEVQVLQVEDSALSATDKGTELFAALRAHLRGLPRERIAALFLISDGQIHDVPADFANLGLDAPAHLLLTGSGGEVDRRLVVARAPSFALIGKPVTLTFQIEDLSPAAERGSFAQVTLRQDGQELQSFRAPFGVEQEVEVTFARRGVGLVELEVEAGPNEISTVNNRAAVLVNGVRDRLKVLLVSGEPHPGERAWRNILKSDPAVDLVHFTILRPPEKQDGTPIRELALIAFPTRELFEVKLKEFDLIIFDRYRLRGVLPSIYLDNIARYVEQGGALLGAVGPTFATPLSLFRTPLGRVLPGEPTGEVFAEGFQPQVTQVGGRHPVTATLEGGGENPEWGRWFRQVEVTQRDGDALMQGVGGQPLLILSRVGEGRVAQVLSDQMWLWSRGFEGGGPQTELLRRIAHWLMKEPELEEETLSARVEAGRLTIERRSLEAALPDVTVTLPSGEERQVSLVENDNGRAEAVLAADELGLYRVTDGRKSALAAAGALNPKEYEDLRATAEKLRPLLSKSRGGLLWVAADDAPRLNKVKPGRARHGRGWLGVEAKGKYLVTGVRQTALLPPGLMLLAVLAALLVGWFREGR